MSILLRNYYQNTHSFKRLLCPLARLMSSQANLPDEYGKLDCSGDTYVSKKFALECGAVLEEAHVRYNSFGVLNSERDNVLVVCHALTGNSRLDQWWGPLLGPGKAFDTSKYLVVCANILGSCYGSTGPTSIDPRTGRPYGIDFPQVTVRDTVSLHIEMVKQHINAKKVACVVGGSMGGMQALEWALLGGPFVSAAVVIGCGAAHSAWQIAISSTQRQAIFADQKWRNGHIDPSDPPRSGLALARQIAMISYRTAVSFESKFGRERVDLTDRNDGEESTTTASAEEKKSIWQVQSYLDYQGRKFIDRFDAVSYVKITEQMDTHDVGRARGGVKSALATISSRVLVIGIDSDLLYPLHEQQNLVESIPNSTLQVVQSINGHDGFLVESEKVSEYIRAFL